MSSYDYIERILMLSKMQFRYLNIDAIFSDEGKNYRFPASPKVNEKVIVKLRVAKNDIDEAFVVANENMIPMIKTATSGRFDYYSGDTLRYRKNEILFQDRKGRQRLLL